MKYRYVLWNQAVDGDARPCPEAIWDGQSSTWYIEFLETERFWDFVRKYGSVLTRTLFEPINGYPQIIEFHHVMKTAHRKPGMKTAHRKPGMKYTQEQLNELQTEIRRAIAEDDSEVCAIEDFEDESKYSVPVLTNNGVDILAQIACAQVEPWLESLQPAGHWTTQPPTEPGWYWYDPPLDETQVVHVWRSFGKGELRATVDYTDFALTELEGTWYSEPLTVPGPNRQESEGK